MESAEQDNRENSHGPKWEKKKSPIAFDGTEQLILNPLYRYRPEHI